MDIRVSHTEQSVIGSYLLIILSALFFGGRGVIKYIPCLNCILLEVPRTRAHTHTHTHTYDVGINIININPYVPRVKSQGTSGWKFWNLCREMLSAVCISLKWVLIHDHTSKRIALNWILLLSHSMAPPMWDNLELHRLKSTSDNTDTWWPAVYLCNVSEWMIPKFLKSVHITHKSFYKVTCVISAKNRSWPKYLCFHYLLHLWKRMATSAKPLVMFQIGCRNM